MSDYEPGDVLIVRFPFQEDPTKFKIRPALLLSVEGDTYTVCRITKTNRSGSNKGEWIHSDTLVGGELGLNCDSFIDLDTIRHIRASFIIHHKSPIGEYRELGILLSKYDIEL